MPGIRLEFAQFGHFDSFDIIRSMTSMVSVSDVDLPTPIATGVKTMYYVDTGVVEGATYYYKVRVWRNGVSYVSDEVLVYAQLVLHRVELWVANDALTDRGSLSLTWLASGVSLINTTNEIHYFDNTSYLKSVEFFDWAGAWDIEFDVYIDSSVSTPYKPIVSNRYNVWDVGGLFIYYGDSGSGGYEVGRFGIGNYGANGVMSSVTTKNEWHHLRCVKTDDHRYTMYLDDVLQYSNQLPNNPDRIPTANIINLGRIQPDISSNGVRIRNFVIK